MAFVYRVPIRPTAPTAASSRRQPLLHNRGPIRRPPVATTDLPPPPPPPNNNNNNNANNNNDDSPLSNQRSALERTFRLTLTPTGSRTGQCTCIWCQGSKVRKCSWCGGKGYREEIVNKSWEELANDIERMHRDGSIDEPSRVRVECAACGGAKTLRCIYCRGSGVGSYGHAY